MLRNIASSSLSGSDNDVVKDVIFQNLHSYPVRGVWSETIVPTLKDFMRWTKKVITQADIPKFLTQNAGDIALAALGTVQPEIAGLLTAGLQAMR